MRNPNPKGGGVDLIWGGRGGRPRLTFRRGT